MQAAHTVCTYAPQYHQRCWLLNRALIIEDIRDFQQECQIWTRLTIEHFSTLKESILNEAWPTGQDGASGPCSHMASFLHDRALVGICRWHGGLCFSRQWILKVFLGPFSNVNDRIMPMSDAVSSEGLKKVQKTIQKHPKKSIRPCPLCTEISPVSLNLLMMLCTVDDEICKAFVDVIFN